MEVPKRAAKFRNLGGRLGRLHTILLFTLTTIGALWSLEIHNLFEWQIFKVQVLALVFVIALVAVFTGVRATQSESGTRVPWFDWVACAATVVVGGYVVVRYPDIVYDLGSLAVERWLLGGVAILLVIEATRRMIGWSLVVLAVVFIVYSNLSTYAPWLLNVPGSNWDRIGAYLYLDSNALFGLPLDVTTSMIIAFILFGRTLYAVKGDQFLTDFAMATMGRYRGAAAKVAVLASSFFGTISGSAVSNVVMDGPITIPMMQKSGYPSHLAAATEAVASTGGQIMPPVMGITAFLIAEYLSVPYSEVILAALIPAVLYYVALFIQIDLEAAKHNLAALHIQIPRLRDIMGRSWVFIVPICVLVWTLVFENWRPGKAAMAAVVATILIGMVHRETRPTLAGLLDAVEETGRTVLDMVVITAIAGLVIGALQLSGLAFNFSLMLLAVSEGSLLTLLLLTAVVCIILGMGMPTAVTYVLLAVLVAPALIEFGVIPMAAHLFLFYFGMLSMITPPVCLATFAAAAIAHTDFWRAGWTGVRLAFVAYLVPFAIVYQPALIGQADGLTIFLAFSKAIVGVALLSVGTAGYLFARLTIVERVPFWIAGLLLLFSPTEGTLGIGLQISGLLIAGAMIWHGRRSVLQATS